MNHEDLLAEIKRLEQELRRPEPLRVRAAAHRRTGVSAMNAWYLAEEPAAYLCLDISRLRAGHCADKVLRFNKPKQAHIVDIVPLYPKREWVGLTDEDINSWDLPDKPTVAEFARFVEDTLRSKNT